MGADREGFHDMYADQWSMSDSIYRLSRITDLLSRVLDDRDTHGEAQEIHVGEGYTLPIMTRSSIMICWLWLSTSPACLSTRLDRHALDD